MRNFCAVGPVVVVTLLLVACSSSAAQIDQTTGAMRLALRVEAPEAVTPAEPVTIVLSVTNTTADSLEMLSGIPPEEFVVMDGDGEVVWSSLATAACPASEAAWSMDRDDCTILNGFRASAAQDWGFGPGEEKTLTGTWDGLSSGKDALPAGDYLLTGKVQVSDGEISADAITIRVLS